MKKGKCFNVLLLMAFFFVACNDDFVPKSISYPKIIFPEKKYQLFDMKKYPYQFEYPVYCFFQRDSSFFGDKPDNPYWFNLSVPVLNATIYVTYESLSNHKLDQLIFDSYKITTKQIYKATAIEDSVIASNKGYKLVLYNVSGNAATTHQFFATDTKKHFIRGSLYLNSTPNEDSTKIVTDFMKKDIVHLLQTIQFK